MPDTDRITKLITNKAPGMRDIASALNAATQRRISYGEALNAVRAGKIREEQALLDAFTNKRKIDLAEKEYGLAERQLAQRQAKLDFDMLKNLADRGQKDAQSVRDAITTYVPNENEYTNVLNTLQDGVREGKYQDPDPATADQIIGQVVRDMQAEGKIKLAKPETEKSEFGQGMEGQAYDALMEYNAYLRNNEEPPKDVVAKARIAGHVLSRKRFFRDPEGNLMSYTPGVPEGFQVPDGASAPSPAPAEPGAEAAAAPPHEIKEEIPKEAAARPESAMNTLGEISTLLTEAKKEGETVTGVQGWLKKKGGGFARQAGIPVSSRSERLSRLLETLQAQVGPLILNEKRLSETERARLSRIVGDVNPSMDDVALRESLLDILNFIEQAGK